MDRISGLPDELLLKILSSVPIKVAVSTSILSKRWKFLWLWLPKLIYVSEHSYRDRNPGHFRDFIRKNLPLHRALVLESLHLEWIPLIEPGDLKKWIEIAVSRHVRELVISSDYLEDGNIFPISFYTCKSLVIMKLSFVKLMDVPSMVCFPALKTLQLKSVRYEDGESLQQLLSICPVLEDLLVEFDTENMEEFTIIVPSLQKLELYIPDEWDLSGYEIDTPSLKYFKLEDWNAWPRSFSVKDMPMLREAYVDVRDDLENVIGSITSVKRLTICSDICSVDDAYGDGIVFNKLEHLTLCLCKIDSLNLLGDLLKDSPNLRVLDFCVLKYHGRDLNDMVPSLPWNQPSDVPECLLSSLQTVNWSRYFGRPQDRDALVYILKNACHLKRAVVKADTMEYYVTNLTMIKEFALSSRASTTCELEFVEGIDIDPYLEAVQTRVL